MGASWRRKEGKEEEDGWVAREGRKRKEGWIKEEDELVSWRKCG
jgi:hypothetical protein